MEPALAAKLFTMDIIKLPVVIWGKHPVIGFSKRLNGCKVFHFLGIHISGKSVIIGKYLITFFKLY